MTELSTLPNLIAGSAGILLSLIFQYVPGLAPWYEAKGSQAKALIMLACLVAVTALAYVSSCYDLFQVVACTEAGFRTLIMAFVVALASNQSTHQLAKHI